MASSSKERITMKIKNPNSLFEQWLIEWRDNAIKTDSKMQYCFNKALHSLRKYPLLLKSGKDCKVLQGFGKKLCDMLDRKLLEYKSKNPNALAIGKCINSDKKHSKISPKKTPSTKEKTYVPTWRSGAYAILVTLYTKSLDPCYSGYMSKADVIKYGKHLCDKSFVKPDPGSYYTAWSSMKTLLDKNLVLKQGNPSRFSLTDHGLELAHKLHNNHITNNSDSSCLAINSTAKDLVNIQENMEIQNSEETANSAVQELNGVECSSSSNTQDEELIFQPHSFEVILLVDKQEMAGSTDTPEDFMLAELTRLNVLYEIRHLKVGDYAWICRQHTSNKELILPYIVERKRMDDFGSSIKDGRFHEQKFRLKQCGIQNLIYLIESYGNNTYSGLPLSTLYQAATNTLLQDGFNVKFTDSLRGTYKYLASLTSIMQSTFKNKTLISCSKENLVASTIEDELMPLMMFQTFNKGASKSRDFKVKEMFIRQLLQLKGMSLDKALAIVENYPTPALLQATYKNKSVSDCENLLAVIHHGKLNKKIGLVISKPIYQLYTNQVLK